MVHRAALVANGGLAAVLGFLDFFSVSLQRVSVGVAANICKALRPELFSQVEGVVPNLSALLLVRPKSGSLNESCFLFVSVVWMPS